MPIPQKVQETYPKTAWERVYNEIRQWIVDGTLKPDEKISDKELADYFSVSRTPVREALKLLADQRLVFIYPGKESRIAPIDPERSRQAYQIIAQLYGLAVESAFPMLKPEHIAALKEANRQFDLAVRRGDHQLTHHYDRQFHDLFLKIAPNDFLSDFINVLDSHVERIENLYYHSSDTGVESVAVHDEIIHALEVGDCAVAVERTRYNWLHTLDVLLLQKSQHSSPDGEHT